jgi:hypothetical protein
MRTIFSVFFILGSSILSCFGVAQELSYFEEKYQTKLDGISPRSTHEDLDQYYTEIAKRLEIPRIAADAVSEKYGWRKEAGTVTRCIIRRSIDKWTIVVFRMHKGANRDAPDMNTYTQRFVQIDDTKRVLYCGDEQPK